MLFLVRSVNNGFQNEQLSVLKDKVSLFVLLRTISPSSIIIKKNWHPISLLNTTYTITSSCIAGRLKKVLPSIIHEDQKGFMKGRDIGENIRLVYDVLRSTEREQIPGLLLLIDFEKAFDSVSWSFLQKALNVFNVGPGIKQWVKTLYTLASSCISVNGQYSQWFGIQRGV